jgi:ATP-dependent DNA helicase DinG
VGKSLAYLAAAIPFAAERAAEGERGPLVISTRTKLLQDQLLGKDIPAAAAMLGHPGIRALSIKGRANYACARRLAQVLAEGREPRLLEEDRLAYAALAACARTRHHGEIGTLPAALLVRHPALRELLRRSVAARAEQCTREQCAAERACPLGRRRAALARADLVVANHDLLLRWPPDYPAFAHAIADEAQELAPVADEAYALEVRPSDLLERFDELFGPPVPPRRRAGAAAPPAGRAPDPRAREQRRALREDLVALGRSLAGSASEYAEVQLPIDAEAAFPDAAALARSAAARLDEIAREVDARAEAAAGDAEPSPAASRTAAELAAAGAALRAAFTAGDPGAVAAFERLLPPYDQWRLALRAVSPAGAFREQLGERLRALACVSASLFVGGDPFAALGELEIGAAPGEEATTLCVDSPFPYAEHMRVVVLEEAEDLVADTAAVVTELARCLGGRTLGLFTSLRRMREVASRVAPELRRDGLELLLPRRATDDPAALVARFSEPGAGRVLLGARTFWQGLDVPGDALQAVVIEKLPFEVPTELRRRREALLRARGLNAFARYSTGKMLLHLKQMVGRLIRSEDDRGVAVIVEGRRDRSYFRRLGEALPPGCGVRVARREELPSLLAELGLGSATTVEREEAAG